MVKPAAVEQVERDLEMALAILRRAGRRLTEALPEMNAAQQEQAQREIESARRELNRMAERIGKEQEADMLSQAQRAAILELHAKGVSKREIARVLRVSRPHGAQSPALELHQRAGDSAAGESRTLPATDPGSFGFLQGESRASP